jgi:hypothetical protein
MNSLDRSNQIVFPSMLERLLKRGLDKTDAADTTSEVPLSAEKNSFAHCSAT